MFLLVLVPFAIIASFDGSSSSNMFLIVFRNVAIILMFPDYIISKLFDNFHFGFSSLIPTLLIYSLIIERLINIIYTKVAK